MATDALDKLRSQVLTLSEAERAELAHDLIKSLDAPRNEDVGEAWEAEILRRLSQIDSGTAKLIDREEFRKRLREKIDFE